MRIRFLDIKNEGRKTKDERRIKGQTLIEFVLLMPLLVFLMYCSFYLHTLINGTMDVHMVERSVMMNKIAANGTNYKTETISGLKAEVREFGTNDKKEIAVKPTVLEFNVEEYQGKKVLEDDKVGEQIKEYYRGN